MQLKLCDWRIWLEAAIPASRFFDKHGVCSKFASGVCVVCFFVGIVCVIPHLNLPWLNMERPSIGRTDWDEHHTHLTKDFLVRWQNLVEWLWIRYLKLKDLQILQQKTKTNRFFALFWFGRRGTPGILNLLTGINAGQGSRPELSQEKDLK